MKKYLILIAALLLTALIAGCGSGGGEKKSTLVYGSGDYTSINPALYEHGEINSLIFSGLTAHDKNGRIVPGLAESWSFDKNTDTYTFHLRKGVKWHDGQPFTAADVKFTLEAIMNPANASAIASNYEDIKKIDVVDDYTVKISLKAPNAALLDYLTVGMLPKHLLEGKNLITDPFNQKPVGTGPYKLTAWDKGQSITLERNIDYFLHKPAIEKVVFKIVPDEKARAMQLKSGELDMAQVTPRDAESFKNDARFQVYRMKTADYRGIMFNFANDLFKNHRELPRALSYAIDRRAIIDSVLLGHGQVAYSPLQAGAYVNPNVEKYAYDPARAKTELERAGWKLGKDGIYEKDGTRLAFTINTREGEQVRIDMANICAQQLRAVGVDAKVAVKPKADWKGQEAFLIGWGSPFDPDDHTYKVFGTQKGSNYNAYSNAKVDEWLQKARETDVESERLKDYQAFQTALAADPPYTFIAYVDAVYVLKKNIKGLTPETVLGHHGVGVFWNIADWTLE